MSDVRYLGLTIRKGVGVGGGEQYSLGTNDVNYLSYFDFSL